MEHLEFVVEFKDGSMGWIDPVDYGCITVDGEYLFVESNVGYTYDYLRSKIKSWAIRPYDAEKTYLSISEYS